VQTRQRVAQPRRPCTVISNRQIELRIVRRIRQRNMIEAGLGLFFLAAAVIGLVKAFKND